MDGRMEPSFASLSLKQCLIERKTAKQRKRCDWDGAPTLALCYKPSQEFGIKFRTNLLPNQQSIIRAFHIYNMATKQFLVST